MNEELKELIAMLMEANGYRVITQGTYLGVWAKGMYRVTYSTRTSVRGLLLLYRQDTGREEKNIFSCNWEVMPDEEELTLVLLGIGAIEVLPKELKEQGTVSAGPAAKVGEGLFQTAAAVPV